MHVYNNLLVYLHCLTVFLYVLLLHRKDLSQLKYTTQCIKESLRLYPPIATVYRELTEDTVIDGYTVPKGCVLSRMN